MKVLITGGAGFIGTNLTIGLLNSGFSVRVFDDLGLDAAFEILENNSEYSVLNIVEEIFKVTAF